jgi:hypothetical protein
MNISAAHGGGEEPEAKRLVQVAAVMGPEVPVPLLERVAGRTEDRRQRSMPDLTPSLACFEVEGVGPYRLSER